jgi:hypothetical protein
MRPKRRSAGEIYKTRALALIYRHLRSLLDRVITVKDVGSTADQTLIIVSARPSRQADTEVDQLSVMSLSLLCLTHNKVKIKNTPTQLELLNKWKSNNKWLLTSKPHKLKPSNISSK